MLSYKKHYPPCPPRQRRTSVARKNSGDYRRDCSLSAPTLPKPHYPSRFPYCNRLYALICFHIRTIPPAFRRASICVCLYGFGFALSLSLFVGEELAPPVAPNLSIPATIAKGQQPLSPHHHTCLPCQREVD